MRKFDTVQVFQKVNQPGSVSISFGRVRGPFQQLEFLWGKYVKKNLERMWIEKTL